MHTTFLYQMGRVGSGSLNASLYESGIKTTHGHWISDYSNPEFSTPKAKIVKLIQDSKCQPLKILTPIREPMARNLSAFTFSLIKYGVSGRLETPEELQKLFIEKYPIEYPDIWFEQELMRTFNFNPFVKKFNYRKGYQFYKIGKHKLLIYRLENIEQVYNGVLQKFLGVRNLKLLHKSNLGTKKYIGNKYEILKGLSYPEEFLERVYNLKYVNHFYTEREIDEFKQTWRKGTL